MATQTLPLRSRRSPVATHSVTREIDRHVRAWYVIHACDSAAEAVHLVDGQLAIGMKPYLLTQDSGRKPIQVVGAAPHAQPGSLLTAWQEVREWRKLLVNPDVAAFEIVHAHTFSAGMSAVRNWPAVVYDIRNFVEARAGTRGSHEFTWLARSFRVAEQFVITRAGAVVVHSHSVRQGVLDRGAIEGNVFQVPEPLGADWIDLLRQRRAYPHTDAGLSGVTFFAPDVCLREQDVPALPGDAIQLLEAFAALSAEVADARLFVEADAGCVQALFERASALGVAGSVHALGSGDRQRAISETDVIIAVANESAETTVLTGLLKGRAVLAADVPATRDASPDGRGVLWFRSGDLRDLVGRAAFLARNPDFRVALAEAGRKHLLEARTPDVLARSYDAIYRHAWERRRSGSASSGMNLQPLTAFL